MSHLVIENRSSLSDAAALHYVTKAAQQFEITTTGTIGQNFDDVTVHRIKNDTAETFIVTETVLQGVV